MRFAPALVAFELVLSTEVALAQEVFVWADIDCARSRIVAPPGAICRTTNTAAGSDVAGGLSQRHAVRALGRDGYVYVVMSEALGSTAFIRTLKNEVEYLKLIDRRAADGSGWSSAMTPVGAAYNTFTSAEGEECVGFRRFGAQRAGGYEWVMSGLFCAPKGESARAAQITRFIEETQPR
jgi:hypothetical protein